MAEQQPTHTALEYQRLQRAAHSLMDTADAAARRGDTATEDRARAAAGRILDTAKQVGRQQ
ncbi:hypothetical protein JK361_22655 [Streptomyces sp. 5-8]|uniref:Uncharacterized protein n=1 Tax=Streptomyces musisoli TaxID=2802280 RepID=A0ABS1P4T0_9ACTN|nr:hypothetical protein [Streptomyces musisoli]MBL1107371.1 hypothetical protein [Streptomyces musisoli]